MIHLPAIIAALLSTYKRCPKCRKLQQFKGAKKGTTVICGRCSHQFTLK